MFCAKGRKQIFDQSTDKEDGDNEDVVKDEELGCRNFKPEERCLLMSHTPLESSRSRQEA